MKESRTLGYQAQELLGNNLGSGPVVQSEEASAENWGAPGHRLAKSARAVSVIGRMQIDCPTRPCPHAACMGH
jgi:hypothetical protein